MVIYYLTMWNKNAMNQHVVCAWKRGGPLRDDLEKLSIPVFIPENNIHGLKTFRRVISYLDSIIESQKIDVIHAHMADGAFWGSIASVRHSIPMLITHHSNKLVPQTPVYFKLLSRVLLLFTTRFAKVNVAVSELVKEILHRQLRLKEANISVVGNGVPMPKDLDKHWIEEELKSRNGTKFHTDGPSIISVGRLVDIKGQSQLVDAAPRILQSFPNAQFTFLGSGPLKSTLEQRAKNLNISNSVTFPGITYDVPSYLRKSDLYVSTSHSEGIPLATLEAMAWKVPVVASDVIGNSDVIKDEVTGLLYPLGDIDRLSLSIIRLLNNNDLVNSLTKKAEQFVDSRFSLKQMALKYDSIYSQIAS